MMKYEDYLVQKLETPDDKEIIRVGKLKTITKATAHAEHLRQWLADRSEIQVVETQEAAALAVKQLQKVKLLALDIETGKTDPEHPQSGLNPNLSRIRLVQYYDGKNCYLFDIYKIGSLEWIKPLLAITTVAHNAVFEAGHFYHQGLLFNALHDSMLMGRVFLNENKSLKDLANDALGLTLDKTLQVSNWNRPILLQEQLEYAAADAVVAFELYQIFSEWVSDNEPNYSKAYEFIRSLIYPITRQLSYGVPFDTEYHNALVWQWEQERDAALKLVNIDNPNSVKQKQQWLMDTLTDEELMDWPLTEKGNLSTTKEVLENATHIPSAKPLADYTRLTSRLSNFGQKLQDQLIDGCLYPGYQIAGMVTGRFSCRNPNIQNIPRSGYKLCFKAPAGQIFVTGDLSQIELRVAGILSEDEVINSAYEQGEDLHLAMAAKMTGKSPEAVSKDERTAAKAVNFGLLFGGGARSLQQQANDSYGVEMSLEQAEEYRELFFETYPQFHEWQEGIVEATNLYESSRSHFVQLTRHYDKPVYTHAMNFPIQSSAWEVLALAILYVDEHASDDIHISHHVYDELTLIAPVEKSVEAAQLLHDAFEHGFHTCFPGAPDKDLVEIGIGQSWDVAGSDEGVEALKYLKTMT